MGNEEPPRAERRKIDLSGNASAPKDLDCEHWTGV